jgi:hypothetical protein
MKKYLFILAVMGTIYSHPGIAKPIDFTPDTNPRQFCFMDGCLTMDINQQAIYAPVLFEGKWYELDGKGQIK